MLMHRFDAVTQHAGDADNRDAVLFGDPRHANRRFSADGLRIHTPFAGDHQVRIAQRLLQMNRLQHNINARFQRGVKEYASRRAHPAGRAAADHRRHILTGCRQQHLSVIF